MKAKSVLRSPSSDTVGIRAYLLRILILAMAGLIAGYSLSDKIIDLVHRLFPPAEPTPRHHKLSSDAWLT